MRRILRAFAWMRWRVFVNSIERTGARDTLERFSIALEQIAPLVAVVLLVPAALLAGGLGAATGYALSGDPRPLLLEVTRYILLAAAILSVVGPLAMPAAATTNAVRLLLLPIPRSTLYSAQTMSAVTDPWILLAVPLLLLVPVGLGTGGAPGAAAVALIAGILLLAALTGLTSLANSLLHLIVRNRRRGELIALVGILLLPMIGMVPALLDPAGRRNIHPDGDRREAPRMLRAVAGVTPYIPTELYIAALRAGTSASQAGRPVALLALSAVALHGAGLLVYGRLLDSPGATGGRRRASRTGSTLRVPGVSPGTSAVALAQVRLAVRTPRGRSILLSPLILFMVFGAVMYRGGDMRLGFFSLENGLGLAAFGGFGALVMILPVVMNQFAIDGAGLTLALLSPLSDRELLAGKAIGNGLIFAGPACVCVVASLAWFPGGSPWLWLSIPLSLAATYVLVTPFAAALSALFPRAVDMNSIGRGSNAHAAAGFIGLAVVLVAAAPSALAVILATRVLGHAAFAPFLLLLWLGISAALAAALFVPVRKLFARRRENLALIA